MANGKKKERVFDLEDRLMRFGVRIMCVVEAMPGGKVGNHVASQLIRCGTSAPSNYAEAQSGESRADFIHKMNIALKELRETLIWLKMARLKPLIKPPRRFDPIITECDELVAIFVASVLTAKKNRPD